MSYQFGLKGVLAGIRKKLEEKLEDKPLRLPALKPLEKTTANMQEDSTSNNLVNSENMALPDRTLKRKETVIFEPLDLKGKDVVAEKSAAGPSQRVDPPSPTSTAGTLCYDPPSPTNTTSTASTIPAGPTPTGKGNGPAVHYFCYESRARRGNDNAGKDLREIILIGFNDKTAIAHLYKDNPADTYKVPRLYIGSHEEISVGRGATGHSVSGYVQQMEDDVPVTGTEGADSEYAELPRLTMGKMNNSKSVEFFMLGPNDLIVLEPVPPADWRDGGVPWAHCAHNIFPFAHHGHFERMPIKHFAWEWLKYTGHCVMKPVSATQGVHVWLIDYDLHRTPKYRQKTAVVGHRHIFYGNGARFVEVRQGDKEWKDYRPTGHLGALKQVKLWKQRMKQDDILGVTYHSYQWPMVGVLACEVGES